MKKLILLPLFLILLCFLVGATFTTVLNAPGEGEYTTSAIASNVFNYTAVNTEYEGFNYSLASQTGFAGIFNNTHNWTNATDGSFTTWAAAANNTWADVRFNFSGIPYGTQNSSLIQIADGSATINLSIDKNCWSQTVKQFRVNLTDNQTGADSTITSCYNGSLWETLRTSTTNAIYDVRMWWDITNHTEFKCDVLQKNQSQGNWTVLSGDIRVENGTDNLTTITLTDNTRYWWQVECEDDFSGVKGNSSAYRVLDVDIDYYILNLGANDVINFDLITGDITTIGDITADNIIVSSVNITTGNLDLAGNITVNEITADNINAQTIFINNTNEISSELTIVGIPSVSLAIPGISIGATSGDSGIIIGVGGNDFGQIFWRDEATDYFEISATDNNNPLNLQAQGGKVGIGIKNPKYYLDVNGTVGFNNTLFVINDKVGIGTETPSQNLEVVGNVNVTQNVTTLSLCLCLNGCIELGTGNITMCEGTTEYNCGVAGASFSCVAW